MIKMYYLLTDNCLIVSSKCSLTIEETEQGTRFRRIRRGGESLLPQMKAQPAACDRPRLWNMTFPI